MKNIFQLCFKIPSPLSTKSEIIVPSNHTDATRKQKLLTFPKNIISLPVLMGLVLLNDFIHHCLSCCCFVLVIAWLVLQFTVSDYHCVISKHFLSLFQVFCRNSICFSRWDSCNKKKRELTIFLSINYWPIFPREHSRTSYNSWIWSTLFIVLINLLFKFLASFGLHSDNEFGRPNIEWVGYNRVGVWI